MYFYCLIGGVTKHIIMYNNNDMNRCFVIEVGIVFWTDMCQSIHLVYSKSRELSNTWNVKGQHMVMWLLEIRKLLARTVLTCPGTAHRRNKWYTIRIILEQVFRFRCFTNQLLGLFSFFFISLLLWFHFWFSRCRWCFEIFA